jgi:hypothetical protein
MRTERKDSNKIENDGNQGKTMKHFNPHCNYPMCVPLLSVLPPAAFPSLMLSKEFATYYSHFFYQLLRKITILAREPDGYKG